jgi:heterodisulfide reductase subunit A
MAGTCLGPKDIPDSVAQGSAAAARVLQNILKGHLEWQYYKPDLKEIEDRINET